MGVACQCWGPPSPWWEPNSQLDRAVTWSRDPDWRIREWAAGMAGPDWSEILRRRAGQARHPGEGATAARWEELLLDLQVDPHEHVRAAVHRILGTGQNALQEEAQALAADLDRVTAGATDQQVTGFPWATREQIAAGHAGPVPGVLLDDPICLVRRTALYKVPPGDVSAERIERLRIDPCDSVRHWAVWTFGPDPRRPVSDLNLDERQALAHVTSDPAQLVDLAADPHVWVRRQAARNPSCPPATLVALAHHPRVFGAALANPNWPVDVPTPDPFATIAADSPPGGWPGDPLAGSDQPQITDPEMLCETIVNTRAQMPCTWCDQDAVALHTWGRFCLTHLDELSHDRTDPGGAVYLAERLRSGLWVHWMPRSPVEELWHGPPS